MSDQELTALDAEGVAVDPHKLNRAALRAVDASNLGERMKTALRMVAGGVPFRRAAELQGYQDHRGVWGAAHRYGIVDTRLPALIASHRRVAHLTNEELEQRLVTAPKEISDRDLIVAGGVATDKALAHAKGKSDSGEGFISALERLGEKVIESGHGVEVTVSLRPTDPVDEAVDVTPEPSGVHESGRTPA